jgi:hypothetical protein
MNLRGNDTWVDEHNRGSGTRTMLVYLARCSEFVDGDAGLVQETNEGALGRFSSMRRRRRSSASLAADSSAAPFFVIGDEFRAACKVDEHGSGSTPPIVRRRILENLPRAPSFVSCTSPASPSSSDARPSSRLRSAWRPRTSQPAPSPIQTSTHRHDRLFLGPLPSDSGKVNKAKTARTKRYQALLNRELGRASEDDGDAGLVQRERAGHVYASKSGLEMGRAARYVDAEA